MKQLLKIAIRGIRRNMRRTMITAITICVGVFVILMIQGFLNGLHRGLIDNITQSRTGHIQIFKEGYYESANTLPLNLSIPDSSRLFDILHANHQVVGYSKRLSFAGIANTGEISSMFMGVGVEVDNEPKVCPKLLENIVEGRFIRKDTGGYKTEAVIAAPLAKSLSIKCGSVITLMANTKFGGLNAIDIEIVGILTDRLPLGNNKLIIMPIENARLLLQMENESTEIALGIKKVEKTDEVSSALKSSIAGSDLKMEVMPWDVIAKIFKDIMNIQNAVFWVVKVVLLIIVVSSIINTMLMSVFERVREIGTMMAIGMLKQKVTILFLMETVILGIIGGVIGICLSGIILTFFNIHGFTYTAPGTDFPLTIYPYVNFFDVVFAYLFSIIASLVSAAYPAYKASSLMPTEALRTV